MPLLLALPICQKPPRITARPCAEPSGGTDSAGGSSRSPYKGLRGPRGLAAAAPRLHPLALSPSSAQLLPVPQCPCRSLRMPGMVPPPAVPAASHARPPKTCFPESLARSECLSSVRSTCSFASIQYHGLTPPPQPRAPSPVCDLLHAPLANNLFPDSFVIYIYPAVWSSRSTGTS